MWSVRPVIDTQSKQTANGKLTLSPSSHGIVNQLDFAYSKKMTFLSLFWSTSFTSSPLGLPELVAVVTSKSRIKKQSASPATEHQLSNTDGCH